MNIRIPGVLNDKTLFALSEPIVFRNADVSGPPGAVVKAFAESGWSSLLFIGKRPA